MDLFYILSKVSTDFCSSEAGYKVFGLIGTILGIIQIIIPIILILWGTIDLVKAMISSDESSIKKSQGLLIKRVIYSVIIFFVIIIVKFIFSMVGGSETIDNACFDCLSNPNRCMDKADELKKENSFNVLDNDEKYEYCSNLDEQSCKNSDKCIYTYNEIQQKNECVVGGEINWNE